jgi:hypothetical protein
VEASHRRQAAAISAPDIKIARREHTDPACASVVLV